MPKVIAIACYKGGTGKTTTALNLATFLVERGRTVLLVDLDPSAGTSLALDQKIDRHSTAPLIAALQDPDAFASGVVSPSAWGCDLLPAGRDLMRLPDLLKSRVDGDSALRDLFEDALPVARWDYILLDCPGAAGVATTIAMVAADQLLIPVDCKSDGAAEDLIELWSDIIAIRRRLNPGLTVAGILPCRTDRTKLSRHVVHQISEHPSFNPYMLRRPDGTYIAVRENVAVADAKFDQRPLNIYAPKSHGAEDYAAVAAALEHSNES